MHVQGVCIHACISRAGIFFSLLSTSCIAEAAQASGHRKVFRHQCASVGMLKKPMQLGSSVRRGRTTRASSNQQIPLLVSPRTATVRASRQAPAGRLSVVRADGPVARPAALANVRSLTHHARSRSHSMASCGRRSKPCSVWQWTGESTSVARCSSCARRRHPTGYLCAGPQRHRRCGSPLSDRQRGRRLPRTSNVGRGLTVEDGGPGIHRTIKFASPIRSSVCRSTGRHGLGRRGSHGDHRVAHSLSPGRGFRFTCGQLIV